jgi:hypothetical protein
LSTILSTRVAVGAAEEGTGGAMLRSA